MRLIDNGMIYDTSKCAVIFQATQFTPRCAAGGYAGHYRPVWYRAANGMVFVVDEYELRGLFGKPYSKGFHTFFSFNHRPETLAKDAHITLEQAYNLLGIQLEEI